MASAEQVQVQMMHGLAAVRSGVDDDAIAVREFAIAQYCRGLHQVAEQRRRSGFGVGEV